MHRDPRRTHVLEEPDERRGDSETQQVRNEREAQEVEDFAHARAQGRHPQNAQVADRCA